MMELPEEERAVLTDAVLNLQGGLYALYQLINRVEGKVRDLHSYVEMQQRLPAPGELQEQLKDITHDFDILLDNVRDLDQQHAAKVRSIVDAIRKGVFD